MLILESGNVYSFVYCWKIVRVTALVGIGNNNQRCTVPKYDN